MPGGDLTAYVGAMWDKATTPNGVLGSKLMWNDFDSLRSSLHPPTGTDVGHLGDRSIQVSGSRGTAPGGLDSLLDGSRHDR